MGSIELLCKGHALAGDSEDRSLQLRRSCFKTDRLMPYRKQPTTRMHEPTEPQKAEEKGANEELAFKKRHVKEK